MIIAMNNKKLRGTNVAERRLTVLLKFKTRSARLQYENNIKPFFYLHMDICLEFCMRKKSYVNGISIERSPDDASKCISYGR